MQQIKFKAINTAALWKEFALSDNLSFEDGIRLNSSWTYQSSVEVIEDAALDIADIAVDECDIIYLVDGNKKLLLAYNKNTGIIKDISCNHGVLSVKPVSPLGLAIDKDTLYIIDSGDVQNNPKLIALSRSNLQVRWVLSEGPEGDVLSGLNDISIGITEDILILEKGKKRVLIVSRAGKIIGQKSGGEHANPTDIAVDSEGNIYVLDGQSIFIYGIDGSTKQIKTGKSLKGLSVSRDGRIFAGESGPSHPQKTVHMVMADGRTEHVWSYRGASKRLINDSRGNLYVISDKGDSLSFLEYKKVITKNVEGLYKGTYISKTLDSLSDKTRWHRLLLNGEFVKGTQIELLYYISNTLLTEGEIKSLSEDNWRKCLSDTSAIQGEERRDALFLEDLEGRYLWLKIDLYGNENISPVVKTLTVFFPRVSYLDYLPAVYRDDPASKDFLERFLSLFESAFYEIDFTIDHITRYFDAYGAPPEFLSWLGAWLSISVDDNWAEDKKRLFIRDAISIYKKRGTREGLKDILKLFTGSEPYIVENFRAAEAVKDELQLSIEAGDICKNTDALFLPPDKTIVNTDGGNKPLKDVLFGVERFCFCVLLKPSLLGTIKKETVKRILEEQKPAHTCYGLKILEPWIYLDMHTYLGVNTCLTRPAFLLGKSSVIGRDTILHDTEMSGQVERHSRMGIDTNIT